MPDMKTPGVYIVEKNAFPNSVVEVATAVPAFIGYTDRADDQGSSLLNMPRRITSMAEYINFFGFGPHPRFTLDEVTTSGSENIAFSQAKKDYTLNQISGHYLLYYSIQLFYQNGGGPCYIVSTGTCTDQQNNEVKIDADKLINGIDQLIKEQEPTMLVIPEAIQLSEQDCIRVQQAALAHCGGKMKNRFAILDIREGYKSRQDPDGDCIDKFRSGIGIKYLDYGAAYYPWLNTTIVRDDQVSFENIESANVLKKLLLEERELSGKSDEDSNALINDIDKDWTQPESGKVLSDQEIDDKKKLTNKMLITMSPLFKRILIEMKHRLNLLPPAAAMAGIYTMVDNTRGVWKAPANVSLNSVISPAVPITHDEQEDLNVTTQGKSINAIRSFPGEGVLVWGARTLDGNSLDWRYINVRRTMIMLEESMKLATKAYVFAPNDANTWVTIKSMLSNFLTGIWKRGGLAGASPDDAFNVHVGLGETMTSVDILEGIMRITVFVAVTRPAEFIEITFQQKMQKS